MVKVILKKQNSFYEKIADIFIFVRRERVKMIWICIYAGICLS